MKTQGCVLTASLLSICPASGPRASFTAIYAAQPLRIPYERPEADHPPEGEGSGESPTFLGIGAASGAMTNTTSAALASSSSWEIPSGPHLGFNHFLAKPVASAMLKVGSVMPRRQLLPRARRSC
jgi:hypothetical protein